MKKAFITFFFFLLCPFILLANVEVSTSIDPYQAVEDKAIPGTITIMHDPKERVDADSFQLEGKPLRADFIKNVPLSSAALTISIYRFELPGLPAGSYTLPPISVSVGGKSYRSLATSYQVSSYQFVETQSSEDLQKKPALVFTLNATVNGPPLLYPGMRLWFVYRYSYNGNIELTAESLPLLQAKGFKMIGDKQIKSYQEGENTVQEVSQQIEALQPGTYSFAASYAEGYAYKEENGKKIYIKPKLVAKAPGVEVVVNAFPEKGRPGTFQGAVGDYTMVTSLLSSSSARVDERLLLAIDVAGEGEFATVKLPDLAPLKPFFRINSLPLSQNIEGNRKRFVLEIFPLSNEVKAIPSLSFSFFDPVESRYMTVESPPVPLNVSEEPSEQSVPASFANPQVEPAFYSPKIEPLFTAPLEEKTMPVAEPLPLSLEKAPLLIQADLFNWWQIFRGGKTGLQELEAANTHYVAALESSALSFKEKEFNEALKIYLNLEKQFTPTSGSGHLYFIIGNCYFYLEEYPLALLYYYRAMKLMPRDSALAANLVLVQKELGITAMAQHSLFQPIFFFHYHYSYPERMQICLGLILGFLLLLLLYRFFPYPWMRFFAIVAASSGLILIVSLGYSAYFEPLEGVLIRASLLYRSPQLEEGVVSDLPLPAGTKIEVIDLHNEGRWFKVITSNGELGFIPAKEGRLI